MITTELYWRYIEYYCDLMRDKNLNCGNCKYAMFRGGSTYCNKEMHKMCLEEAKQSREKEVKKILAEFIDDYGQDEATKLCGDFIENY